MFSVWKVEKTLRIQRMCISVRIVIYINRNTTTHQCGRYIVLEYSTKLLGI